MRVAWLVLVLTIAYVRATTFNTGGGDNLVVVTDLGGSYSVVVDMGPATTVTKPDTELIINTEGGNDQVSFTGAFSNWNFPVTVNGGAGTDTVTFLAGAKDFGSGNVAVTCEVVTVSSDISVDSGAGVTLDAATSVTVSGPISVADGGAIDLMAPTIQVTSTLSIETGSMNIDADDAVTFNSATVLSTFGDISVNADGNGAATNAVEILGSQFTAGGSLGTPVSITITGDSDDEVGVLVDSSTLELAVGSLTIAGDYTGAMGVSDSRGVSLVDSTITSTDLGVAAANIVITGTAGDRGVSILRTTVSSLGGGDITVTGTLGETFGVLNSGDLVSNGANGDITVLGASSTTGTGTFFNLGTATTDEGAIQVSGVSFAGIGASLTDSVLESTSPLGGGMIQIIGSGVDGVITDSSMVLTEIGTIDIDGTASAGDGVQISANSAISRNLGSAAGTIDIDGSSTSAGSGIVLSSSNVTNMNGNIGLSGDAISAAGYGVDIADGIVSAGRCVASVQNIVIIGTQQAAMSNTGVRIDGSFIADQSRGDLLIQSLAGMSPGELIWTNNAAMRRSGGDIDFSGILSADTIDVQEDTGACSSIPFDVFIRNGGTVDSVILSDDVVDTLSISAGLTVTTQLDADNPSGTAELCGTFDVGPSAPRTFRIRSALTTLTCDVTFNGRFYIFDEQVTGIHNVGCTATRVTFNGLNANSLSCTHVVVSGSIGELRTSQGIAINTLTLADDALISIGANSTISTVNGGMSAAQLGGPNEGSVLSVLTSSADWTVDSDELRVRDANYPILVNSGGRLSVTRELRNTTIIRQGGTLTGHRCFQVTQAGSIDLQPQSILEVDIGGTTQCSRYDAVQNAPTGISGSICLDVIRSGGFSPGASALFTIFEVRGVAPNTGIFLQDCDLAQPVMEGQLYSDGSVQYRVTYAGGDGNDIVLETFPAPIGVEDVYQLWQNPVVDAADGVLANDFSPTTPPQDPATWVATYVPGSLTDGFLTLYPDGAFQYTPPPGFRGLITFNYTVSVGSAVSPPIPVSLYMEGHYPDLIMYSLVPIRFRFGATAAEMNERFVDVHYCTVCDRTDDHLVVSRALASNLFAEWAPHHLIPGKRYGLYLVGSDTGESFLPTLKFLRVQANLMH